MDTAEATDNVIGDSFGSYLLFSFVAFFASVIYILLEYWMQILILVLLYLLLRFIYLRLRS